MNRSLLNYFQSKVSTFFGSKVPPQLWIAVTYDCQCQCEHCVIGPELNRKTLELSRSDIHQVVKEAQRLGIRRVSLFGGEPLMRDDLTDIVKDTSSLGLKCTIYTNGILLNKENVKRLKAAGLDSCHVSLDSPDKNAHDEFRHYRGCFDKAVQGIKNLVEEGIPASIWTHVSKKDVACNDLRDLKSIIKLGRELSVNNIMVLFPMASGKWLCGWDEILSKEERALVRELFDPPFVRMEFPDEMTTCKGGRLFVYVKPDGSVTPCPTVPYSFGNIQKESLEKILRKIEKEYCNVMSGHHGDCVFNNPSLRDTCFPDIGEKPKAGAK